MGAPETSPPVLEISVKLANLFAIMEESEKRQQAEVGYKFAIDSQKKTLEQLEKLVQDGQEVPDTAVKDAKALDREQEERPSGFTRGAMAVKI